MFAIAITLLVIDIKIAPSEYKHLAHALLDEWPGLPGSSWNFGDDPRGLTVTR